MPARPTLRTRIAALGERAAALKPIRVWRLYSDRRGPLLAAGLTYRIVFGVFGALWAAFSVAGLVVSGSVDLRGAVLDWIAAIVPGLIDTGAGGAIDPDQLFGTQVFGWTGAIALLATGWAALGALSAAREAVREIAQLPGLPRNPVIVLLRDLGLGLGFGAAVVVSALLGLGTTQLLGAVLTGLGVDPDSVASVVLARAMGVLLIFAFDAAILAALYRVLAAVPIPGGALVRGTLLTAAAVTVITLAGGSLLEGSTSNPLLASFAAIVGLLLWFGILGQLVLLGAAWVVVSARDLGVPLDPKGDRDRAEQESRLRLELEERIRAEVEAELPRAVRWLARRSRRRLES